MKDIKTSFLIVNLLTNLSFSQTIINNDSKTSLTGLSQRYMLEKNINTYTANIYINFEFLPYLPKTLEVKKIKKKEKKLFFETVKSCFEKTNESLFKNEDFQLRVKLHYEKSLENKVNKVIINKIKVHRELYDQDSKNWSLETDCHSIVHETLHILGLVDSYPSRSDSNGQLQYPLRADKAAHNVMGKKSKDFELFYKTDQGNILTQAQALVIVNPNKRFKELEDYYLCSQAFSTYFFFRKEIKLIEQKLLKQSLNCHDYNTWLYAKYETL